ncbi:hypothetical protein Dda_4968 [Drechslerella dactyloides]|uniref:GPI anchored protein n=1 Tax=Drechslerella dactyloides TaxID=74499 RepID=A0AAD6NJI7_DREDA|nr:hypothetical protein Dda_4968 [Drechslerella dactyloides]
MPNMRTAVLTLALAVSAVSAQTEPVFPTISAAPGSLPVGSQCSDSAQCANGAQCYGVTAFTIRTCGSFQSVCTSDSQCATNTCNQGFCNGMLGAGSSVSSATPTSTVVPGPSSPPRETIIAAPGTLPLGATCSSKEQCANGADCYATNSMLITRCGNFQSSCTSDNQCATNTCNQGFCNGPLPSGSSLSTYVTATTGTASSVSYGPSGTTVPTGTGTSNGGGAYPSGGSGGNGGNGGNGSRVSSAPGSGATGGSQAGPAGPAYTGAAAAFTIPRGAAAVVAVIVAALAL